MFARAVFAAVLFSAAGFITEAHAIVRGKPVPAMALYGEPKYAPDFTHFDYVNPDAPKGGTYTGTNEAFLTFDTFNAFTIKGAQAYGSSYLLHDTLMAASFDEPNSVYAGLAATIEVAEDMSWVEFVLRSEARFSDGSPITAADVAYSFEIFTTKASPAYRVAFSEVEKAEALGTHTVRFILKNRQNHKIPMLLAASLPIFSQAYWKERDFAETSLDIPVVSGPYNVEAFEVGRYVTYKRLENYWAKDLPVTRGMYNFDRVRYEYFRDDDVQFEAFKTGVYDFTREVVARRWVTGFNFPAFHDGRVKKLEVPSIEPMNVTFLAMNLRRPLFQDRRVRQAINYAFDFESVSKTVMYDSYTRLRSYWQGSPLEAKGLPSEAELKLLEPFRAQLPPELFTNEFTQPTTAGNGDTRANLVKARDLLKEAGWEVKGDRLVNAKTGAPFTFEITLVQANLEQVLTPWLQDMKRLGIEATLRVVDTSQYANRVNDYDYDAIYIGMGTSLTPGDEMKASLSSDAADRPGGANYGGVKDPVVDALLTQITAAATYEDVQTATRALDRVLTFNYYHTLRYGMPAERYAYWTKLAMPAVMPALGLGTYGERSILLWWAALAAAADASAPAAASSEPGASNTRWMLIAALAAAAVAGFVFMRRRRG
jgi:microcin C transport system substrate-binding protein